MAPDARFSAASTPPPPAEQFYFQRGLGQCTQLTTMKDLSRRLLAAWIARATTPCRSILAVNTTARHCRPPSWLVETILHEFAAETMAAANCLVP